MEFRIFIKLRKIKIQENFSSKKRIKSRLHYGLSILLDRTVCTTYHSKKKIISLTQRMWIFKVTYKSPTFMHNVYGIYFRHQWIALLYGFVLFKRILVKRIGSNTTASMVNALLNKIYKFIIDCSKRFF